MASIQEQINEDIKSAMKQKEKEKLEALRAVKSAFLLAGTEKGADGQLSDDSAMTILKRLVKQRRDSLDIYEKQNRPDLAADEKQQMDVIQAYLPEQIGEQELKQRIDSLITEMNAQGPGDMGKVMGVAMKSLGSVADGKTISTLIKQALNS